MKPTKIQEIQEILDLQGCMIEGKVISLNDLDEICQDLDDSDREALENLLEEKTNELESLLQEQEQVGKEIKLLRPAIGKLTLLINLDSEKI